MSAKIKPKAKAPEVDPDWLKRRSRRPGYVKPQNNLGGAPASSTAPKS